MPLTTLERQHRHRDRIKEKLARLERVEGALKAAASDCHLGYDVLGNSGPEFDSVRRGFLIIAERIEAALRDQ